MAQEPDLGAIRGRAHGFLPPESVVGLPRDALGSDIASLHEDVLALLAMVDAQAARLAHAESELRGDGGQTDPAAAMTLDAIRQRAPWAYGQWRADLAALLAMVDQAAPVLDAAEQWYDCEDADVDAGLAADAELLAAIERWRAAREG